MEEDITSYFENGLLIKVTPEGKHQYESRYIITGGYKYDMLIKKHVELLPIPKFNQEGSFPSVTKSEDYILRMIAGNVRKTNHEQSIIILEKACDMMLASNIGWQQKDFMRLVTWMLQDGRVEESIKYRKLIKEKVHVIDSSDMIKAAIRDASLMKTDLICVTPHKSCSEIESKLSGRIYSISGKDKRFPPMPEFPKDFKCGIYPFIYGINIFHDSSMNKIEDVIGYSNRPFIDERTEQEKLVYQQFIDKQIMEQENYLDGDRYYALKALHPDLCPKSRYAFSKLSVEDHDKYLSLVELVKNIVK